MSDSSPRRCSKCANLCLADVTPNGYILHSDVADLLATRITKDATECDLCSLLLWSLKSDMYKVQRMGGCSVSLYRDPEIGQPLPMLYVIVAKEEKRSKFLWTPTLRGQWHLGPPDQEPWLVRGFLTLYADISPALLSNSASPLKWRRVASYSGSDYCFDLVSEWLSDCLTKHHNNCPINGNSSLPTRIVDVGPPDGSQPPKLITTTEGQTGKYIALSYCWGTKPFFLLMSSNKEQLECEVPVKNLPQTICDAIAVARRFGVRHLWVDSLCIIQGHDAEAIRDWEREGQQMDKVFQGAFFTIMAARASDAHQGLFHHRTPPAVPHCGVPINRDQSGLAYLAQYADDSLLTKEPLHQRGWAFQEQFLSIRYVSYGSEELSWACRGSSSRECAIQSIATPLEITHRHQPYEVRKNWTNMVEKYSLMSLTFVSDKLPAIAGLARLGQISTDYFFGAWKDDIVKSLLWRHFGQPVNRQLEYTKQAREERRAPSWSWASVNGKVRFLMGSDTESLRIKQFKENGTILLRGRVREIATMRLQISANYYGGYDNYLPWTHISYGANTYLDSLTIIPSSHCKMAPNQTPELLDVKFLYLGKKHGLILIEARNSLFKRITSAMAETRRLGQRLLDTCKEEDNEKNKAEKGKNNSSFLPLRHTFFRIGVFEGLEQNTDCYYEELWLA